DAGEDAAPEVAEIELDAGVAVGGGAVGERARRVAVGPVEELLRGAVPRLRPGPGHGRSLRPRAARRLAAGRSFSTWRGVGHRWLPSALRSIAGSLRRPASVRSRISSNRRSALEIHGAAPPRSAVKMLWWSAWIARLSTSAGAMMGSHARA